MGSLLLQRGRRGSQLCATVIENIAAPLDANDETQCWNVRLAKRRAIDEERTSYLINLPAQEKIT